MPLVVIPTQLHSYTDHAREVSLRFDDHTHVQPLRAVVAMLDARFPGMGFRIVDEQGRIRRHIAIFIGETLVRNLDAPVAADARVQIVGALSGG